MRKRERGRERKRKIHARMKGWEEEEKVMRTGSGKNCPLIDGKKRMKREVLHFMRGNFVPIFM